MKEKSESRIQSECFLWLWNGYPNTRMTFFAVRNEGAKISYRKLLKSLSQALIFLGSGNLKGLKEILESTIRDVKVGNRIGGALEKSMGVVSGVSDTVWAWKGKTYFIEFKTGKGRQSDEQKKFQLEMERQGFEYAIIRSLDEFKDFIIPKL